MKLSKTTISKTKYFLLALLVTFSFSCNPEDGEDGAPGPAGANGIDGANGSNGEDGNANVQTFVFDTATESGASISFTIPEITQDVIDNDVVLGYFGNNSGDFYQMPGPGSVGNYIVRTYMNVGNYTMRFHNWDGTSYSVTAGSINPVKIIIIESTSTTNGRINAKQQVYNELNQAGVNLNDYYAVCDYYGIAY